MFPERKNSKPTKKEKGPLGLDGGLDGGFNGGFDGGFGNVIKDPEPGITDLSSDEEDE